MSSLTVKNDPALNAIVEILSARQDLKFAVLVGSRATGKARPESDWDIALLWMRNLDWFRQLGETETLRLTLPCCATTRGDGIG